VHVEPRQQVLQDREARPEQPAAATMRSPACTLATSALNTAAMPVAVAQQASAPSSARSRSCSMVTVGLDTRE
jgi:hypothetical protein